MQERERYAATESEHGYGISHETLADFFAGIDIIDPGVPLVRVGPSGDGGYLLPDDLEGVVECFSPGVADEIGFDLALAELGMQVHLIDASVDGLPQQHPGIDFEPLFLGTRTSAGWTTLEDWVDRRGDADGDALLEMDIEGAEWGVLLATPDDVLARFRMLVIEMHDLHTLARPSGFHVIAEVFDKLAAHFDLVHVHPNNHEYPVPYAGFDLHPVIEATFLRKDRAKSHTARTSLVHALDQANTDLLIDFPLDPAWLCAPSDRSA